MTYRLLLAMFLLIALIGGAYAWHKSAQSPVQPLSSPITPSSGNAAPVPDEHPNSVTPESAAPTPAPTLQNMAWQEPVDQFKSRVTKKPFGIYITPATSPVQPEKFTGYHTGVDVEYQDVVADVPVHAIADGMVVLSRTASGYGGVMVIRHAIDSKQTLVVYGHLRATSMKGVGVAVKQGDAIAVLGTGYSSETDGERRHLHFGVLAGSTIDIKGYVQTKAELSGWVDPLSLYP